MTSLAALWLPILLSAVFVFIASSIIHMALPIHKKDFRGLPDEDALRAAINSARVPPGQYMVPHSESGKPTEEWLAKMKEGPVGTMIIRPAGEWKMGPALFKWFVFTLLVSLFAAYLTAIHNGPGAGGARILQMTGAVAFLGYVFSQFHEWTWKGLGTDTMVRFAIDGVIYTLITAGTFVWLWPAAA